MSYILDALKKVEDEKNRKNRQSTLSAASGELFAKSSARKSSRSYYRPVIILCLMAATAAAGFLMLKKSPLEQKNKQTSQTSPSVKQASPAAVAAPQPLPQTVSPAPEKLQPVPQAVPAAIKKEESVSVKKTEAKAAAKKPVQPKQPPALQSQSLTKIAPPADIQVSGVAWNDEKSMRRAVINGLLLKEGAQVSGATVKEIQPDRVRFEKGGGQFEIPFVSSAVTGGAK